MSVDQAVKLRSELASNEGLRNKLSGAGPDDGKKILADAGYGDVSKEDMDAAAAQGGELSDSEMAGAAGAGSTGSDIGSAIGSAVEDAGTAAWDEISSWF